MAEAKPVQPFADRAAMHRHAMKGGQFGHDLVQGQVTLDRQPLAQPGGERGKLALRVVALPLRGKPAALALQDHHVVHEPWGHPKVPRRLSMSVPFLDKRNDPAPQLYRMWLAHLDPLHLARPGNHNPLALGILNRMSDDTL